MRNLYATDASVYNILPLAVALPKTKGDIKKLVAFATKYKTSLIPRTAGTSLAGQCVGKGIVVDVSKYFTNILELDTINKTVTVEPGVIRDELNTYLKPFGLFFAPNTSTSNRCMIGGMVGNNSSGTTSIKYGVTRDKVIEMETVLSNGITTVFKPLSKDAFLSKIKLPNLEGHIHNTIYKSLSSKNVQQQILNEFPDPKIHRRNTGYALDVLIDNQVFSSHSIKKINICKLLSGSEGTLAITTKIKLQLESLPPKHNAIIALHFNSITNCLQAVNFAMKHDLHTCEMLDKTILDCTKHNKQQQVNRQFIKGNPEALLLCELKANSQEELKTQITNFNSDLDKTKLAYAYVILKDENIDKALKLRAAGLGLLGNLIGDKKSVACIEDTAVTLKDLPNYINDFSKLMQAHKQKAIYYAHAGAGELHLRPILNLKTKNDVKLFRVITTQVAQLVKQYKGSFSGEHGDGIVRSEFIEFMIGKANYNLLKTIKTAFDPQNIFNPGKIVNPLPMDKSFRYKNLKHINSIETLQDFSSSLGIYRETEKCNGSGDCRSVSGGTMCPSYRATKNEKDTTRARANALRMFLEKPNVNAFNYNELNDVFKNCLSCKACKTECPSSVDVAALKSEFLYQQQTINGFKFKDKFFANVTKYNKLSSKFSGLSNVLLQSKITSKFIKTVLGVHAKRSLPKISKSFSERLKLIQNEIIKQPIKTVYLFVDEYINYLDSNIAIDALELLQALNYNVIPIHNIESGRSYISKGFLEEAKILANANIEQLGNIISKNKLLIGIEPSAIYTFTDDYLRLCDDKDLAKKIADNTFLIDAFFAQEITLGNITQNQFTTRTRTIKHHGHCYQKALGNQHDTFAILNLPKNYNATILNSGCCGMAGSFGYNKDTYKISMKIGEQSLFNRLKNIDKDVIVSTNGTSCRHQILDGTSIKAKHPITILKEALL